MPVKPDPTLISVLRAARAHYSGVKWSTWEISEFLIETATRGRCTDISEALEAKEIDKAIADRLRGLDILAIKHTFDVVAEALFEAYTRSDL